MNDPFATLLAAWPVTPELEAQGRVLEAWGRWQQISAEPIADLGRTLASPLLDTPAMTELLAAPFTGTLLPQLLDRAQALAAEVDIAESQASPPGTRATLSAGSSQHPPANAAPVTDAIDAGAGKPHAATERRLPAGRMAIEKRVGDEWLANRWPGARPGTNSVPPSKKRRHPEPRVGDAVLPRLFADRVRDAGLKRAWETTVGVVPQPASATASVTAASPPRLSPTAKLTEMANVWVAGEATPMAGFEQQIELCLQRIKSDESPAGIGEVAKAAGFTGPAPEPGEREYAGSTVAAATAEPPAVSAGTRQLPPAIPGANTGVEAVFPEPPRPGGLRGLAARVGVIADPQLSAAPVVPETTDQLAELAALLADEARRAGIELP